MAQPITWQNIRGVDVAAASAPLQAASQGFNQGLAQIGQVLQANEERQKQANTVDYLNQLNALGRDPASLQKSIQSGDVDRLRASYGTQIDQNAIRGAAENLLNTRYTQAKQAVEFKNFMEDTEQAPIRDQYKTAALRGDTNTLTRLEQENPHLRNFSELAGFADQANAVRTGREREGVRFGREGEKFDIEKRKAADELLTSAVQRTALGAQAESARASAESSRAQTALAGQQFEFKKDEYEAARKSGAAQAARQQLADQGNIYSEGIYTGKQALDLGKDLKTAGLDITGNRLSAVLGKFAGGTIELKKGDPNSKVPVPVSSLKAALAGTTDTWYDTTITDSGFADDVEDNLRKAIGRTYKGTDAQGKAVNKKVAVEDYNAFQNALTRAVENPQIQRPTRTKNPFSR